MKSLTDIENAVVNCRHCPELRAYTALIAREKKRAHRQCEYWGKPVPAFGDPRARLMIVGLAPGAHGSNRTGRPFTGDASGGFLYPALHRAGFASQPDAFARDDGLRLRDCLITAALRCAPPKNMPTPQELQNCFPYLVEEFEALERVRVVVALGAIALRAVVRLLREREFSALSPLPRFAHGVEFAVVSHRRVISVIGSYHPSRQNTNTRKLTVAMFDTIFTRANAVLQDADASPGPAPRERHSARPSSRRVQPDFSETP